MTYELEVAMVNGSRLFFEIEDPCKLSAQIDAVRNMPGYCWYVAGPLQEQIIASEQL